MKLSKILIIFFQSIAPLTYAQIAEHFDDGELLTNPRWSGTVSSFFVDPAGILRLDAPESVTAYISTPSRALWDASWELRVGMEFNPSSNNFCRIYLASNTSRLEGALEGYYVQLGGAEDEISLYRQAEDRHHKIIDGIDGFIDLNDVDVVIYITRDLLGTWTLQARSEEQENFTWQGSVTDTTQYATHFFGVFCQFTATRSDKFFFDDIQVGAMPLPDTIPPALRQVRVLDDHRLELLFTEPMASMGPGNFNLESSGNPAAVQCVAPDIWELNFLTAFQNGHTYTITGHLLADLAGNSHSFTELFVYAKPGPAQPFQMIITEIMADPNPALLLPVKEYVEIYNNSDLAINLKDWTFADENRGVKIPEEIVLPGKYLILCPASESVELLGRADVLGLPAWPALNNSGDLLILMDPSDNAIHFVPYEISWYRSEIKQQGGWSLELIDTRYPCSGATNWAASVSQYGGTPGLPNSIATDNPDLTPPAMRSVFAADPATIEIRFDQMLDRQRPFSRIWIDPPLLLDSLFFPSSYEPLLVVKLSDSLVTGVLYSVLIEEPRDCNGNVSVDGHIAAPVGLPVPADSSDVVINEILFNPWPLGKRFVELYNRSQKPINLKNWSFARWDESLLTDMQPVTGDDLVIYPDSYLVFTEDPSALKNQYPKCADIPMEKIEDLPMLGDTEGSLLLVDPKKRIIDHLEYHEDMHHPLLIEREGVSLERASVQAGTNDAHNWHSASEPAGYATPGKPNSQQIQVLASEGSLKAEPPIITPTSGVHPPYTHIQYYFPDPGRTGSVIIFDSRGHPVRVLVNNTLLGIRGFFQWDGTDQDQRVLPMGIYVILLETMDRQGSSRRFKETVVIAPK